MLWEQGDIDEKVILRLFLTCVMTRDEDGKIDIHCNPLGSPLTPLVGLNRESMESNLTHLRLPDLKIGDGQHTTHALGRNLTFRASL